MMIRKSGPVGDETGSKISGITAKSLAVAALSASLAFEACLPAAVDDPPPDTSPNILWLVLDHVTFHHYMETEGARPTLAAYERLATEGIEFERAYSIHPICCPARASMLTGMYPINHGIYTNTADRQDVPKMRSQILYNQHLKARGYAVAHFGKVHAGIGAITTPANGFDGWGPVGYGNPYLEPLYKDYIERNDYGDPLYYLDWGVRGSQPNRTYNLFEVPNFNGPSTSGPTAGYRGFSTGYFTNPNTERVHEADWLASEAMDYINQQVTLGKKFSVALNVWGPHQPYQVPQGMRGTIDPLKIPEYPNFHDHATNRPQFVRDALDQRRNETEFTTWEQWQTVMARAYEAYTYVDMVMGRMLDYLDEKGLAGNTLVILTADHGDELGSFGGLIDKAGNLSEEVNRIPLVIRWPGKITPGTKSRALVSNVDITPTIIEASGSNAFSSMDGRSLLPLFRGDESKFGELLLFHYGHNDRWSTQRALYYGDYKYIASRGAAITHELYNLKDDPFELTNLAQSTDPEIRAAALDMTQRMLAYMDRIGDDMNLYNTLALRNDLQSRINNLSEGL